MQIYKYIYDTLYMYTQTHRHANIHIYIWVEHSGKGVFGCHSHNAKLFQRIEHSGFW